jgi:hypothetical protein
VRLFTANSYNKDLQSLARVPVLSFPLLNFCYRLGSTISPFRRPMDTIKATQCVDVLPID